MCSSSCGIRSRSRWCRYGETHRKKSHGLRRWKMPFCLQPAPVGKVWIFRGYVSSLIIVKLPFAVPDPIHEAQREQYRSLESYIQNVVVPDMQKKLRQGFGRAIRTEQDTCVVSILDHRAAKERKRYRELFVDRPRKCRWQKKIDK